MWKYIEGKDAKGKSIGEDVAREFFGVNDKKCPVVALDNGHFAVWCAAPLAKPSAYPELSHNPKDKASGFASCKA